LNDKNSGKLMQKYRLWVAAKADLANREREARPIDEANAPPRASEREQRCHEPLMDSIRTGRNIAAEQIKN